MKLLDVVVWPMVLLGLSPFLLASYSRIHILDLRYYRASLSDYIAQNGFDDVLVCYSIDNFSTDSNIFLLGR